MYQPCYGGIADEAGVLEENDDYITLMIPESVTMTSNRRSRMLEVCIHTYIHAET